MPATTVIRFGALGDLCICSWFLAGLAERPDAAPLRLITKPAFADLARAVPGVDEVVPLPDGGLIGLWRLSRRLGRRGDTTLIDAHAVLRSRLICLLAGRRPDTRLLKDTAARLALVRGGDPTAVPGLDRHLLDRFDALVAGAPGRDRLQPILRPPLASLATDGRRTPHLIGMAPGARWPSKRWHDSRFHETAKILLEDGATRLRLVVGPDETWFDGSDLATLDAESRVEIIRDAPLTAVADALAGCAAVLTNDSGLLHLSEAVGTPVAAVFGPTVRAFGYAPLLPTSRILETDLDCRPCSRTGSKACHRGDLACLEAVSPTTAAAALRGIVAAGDAS